MKNILKIVVVGLLFYGQLFAEVSSQQQIVVNVKGLVCDFCARGLTRVFSKQAEVQKIDVSLKKSKVTIILKEGKKLEHSKIIKLIKDNGISVVKIIEMEYKGEEKK